MYIFGRWPGVASVVYNHSNISGQPVRFNLVAH